MSNLDDIFDLPEGQTAEVNKPEKKQRKKVEMSDEKKTAMLERLKAGREKRQENLKAKTQPKEEVKQPEVIVTKKEVVKQPKVVNKTNDGQGYEDEKLSFIKMMAGKSKPIEKVERPKKKVYTEPKEPEQPKVIIMDKEQPKRIAAPVVAPVVARVAPVSAPVASPVPIVKVPVIIRNFKKPIWG